MTARPCYLLFTPSRRCFRPAYRFPLSTATPLQGRAAHRCPCSLCSRSAKKRYLTFNLSIHLLKLLPPAFRVEELNPTVFGQRQGNKQPFSLSHTNKNMLRIPLTWIGDCKSPIHVRQIGNLLFLHGRKLENPWKNPHRHKESTQAPQRKAPVQRVRPTMFVLWGDSGNHQIWETRLWLTWSLWLEIWLILGTDNWNQLYFLKIKLLHFFFILHSCIYIFWNLVGWFCIAMHTAQTNSSQQINGL